MSPFFKWGWILPLPFPHIAFYNQGSLLHTEWIVQRYLDLSVSNYVWYKYIKVITYPVLRGSSSSLKRWVSTETTVKDAIHVYSLTCGRRRDDRQPLYCMVYLFRYRSMFLNKGIICPFLGNFWIWLPIFEINAR